MFLWLRVKQEKNRPPPKKKQKKQTTIYFNLDFTFRSYILYCCSLSLSALLMAQSGYPNDDSGGRRVVLFKWSVWLAMRWQADQRKQIRG